MKTTLYMCLLSAITLLRLVADEPRPLPNSTSNTSQTHILDIGQGVTLELVWIPDGTFWMGSTICPGTIPIHKVTLSKGFWIGKYEVTQKQYETVMGLKSGGKKDDLCPVTHISWNDALNFLQRLSSNTVTQGSFRLPTEAEWEYACTTNCPSGWNQNNSASSAHPVGTMPANVFGLYDMLGNTLEWCSDWYVFDYYEKSPEIDPQGAETGICRVLRGGSWRDLPADSTPYVRNRAYPENHDDTTGFRIVMTGPPPTEAK